MRLGIIRLSLSLLMLVALVLSTLDVATWSVWPGALLVVLAGMLWRWFHRRETVHLHSVLYTVLCVGASASITQHALAAERAHMALIPFKASPNLGWLYLALHCGLVLWLILEDLLPPAFQLPAVWPVSFLFSSYLYFRTFFVAEQGAPYAAFYVLILGYTLLKPRWLLGMVRHTSPDRAIRCSLLVFLFVLGLSTAFSFSPGESSSPYLQIICFVLLPFMLAEAVARERRWRLIAGWAVILGGMILVGLAGIKFAILIRDLGLSQAVRHRLFIAEISPNWLSRPLVILLPLGISLLLTAPNYYRKALWGTGIVGMLLTLAYSQSNQGFGGWLALASGVGALALLLRWPAITRWWKGHTRARGVVVVAVLVFAIALVGLGVWLAVSMNAYSFNGRLYVWRTALYQAADRPLVGSGLGVRYKASQHSAKVRWDDMGPRSQWFIDHPLSRWWQKRQTSVHTHNLFLEFAAGGGAPAMLAFLWLLWELAKYSLATLSQAQGRPRVLIAGCIAGIVGALGWGALDVMEYSPPFFTFPTWVLIGLLVAAPRALGGQEELKAESGLAFLQSRRRPPQLSRSLRSSLHVLCCALLLLSAVAVIAPLLGNWHYRRAYVAYQERRWDTAIDELERAGWWGPLNAKYQQLRGEALINLGRYTEAISAYEHAARLKRDYAPYHAQLGWLYWLQGDSERATKYLEQAVEMDPREIWRDALHADLGLAYAAQGRVEEAVLLLKDTIELNPQMALEPYWVPVQHTDGTFDVVLDPAYASEDKKTGRQDGEQSPARATREVSDSLQRRILAHLGKADYTPRLFALDMGKESVLSFNQVLDAIEADYVAARTAEGREAPRLLAAAAEAARLVGLYERAGRTYREFQETYPASSFGFRDLGVLYRAQGSPQEAYRTLDQATRVSPRDVDSWIGMAEIALDRGLVEEAKQSLDTLYRLAPLTPQLYILRARLYQQQGDLAQAAQALRQSLVVEESVPNRISLAELYRQQEKPQLAGDQCVDAADVLRRTWPRPLDPALWEIGVCLAETGKGPLSPEIEALGQMCPLIGNVLLGHVYRAQGMLDRALDSYRTAADARPDEGGPYYLMGETHQALGQIEMAGSAYLQAFQLNPLESLPLLALGRLREQTGQYVAAQESFRAATEATPGWGQAHVALGNALLQAGDRKGAARHYQWAQIADRDVREDQVYDFAAHLAEAEVRSPGPEHVRNDYFTIGSDQRRVLFAHPESRVIYRLRLPEDAVLAFDVATAPESWEQPGDGVLFAVYVQSGQNIRSVDSLSEQPIFGVYLDPKRDEAARRWYPFEIDLSSYGGQAVNIVFETGAGPTGDERFDWAGWGEPRLLLPLS